MSTDFYIIWRPDTSGNLKEYNFIRFLLLKISLSYFSYNFVNFYPTFTNNF